MRRADIEVPNPAVAMDARAGLACYPRGSFYPISKGTPTSYPRITLTCFRNCSTCMSHSKAGFCQYTRCLVSIQAEPTFVRLRYYLASNLPSQTAHHALSPNRITARVRNTTPKGWYYTGDSAQADAHASKSPTYSLHSELYFNTKLQ